MSVQTGFLEFRQQGQRGPYSTAASSPIAKARRHLGLTKVDAAKRCGVSLRTYERAEAGDVVMYSTRRKVERALGIRI